MFLHQFSPTDCVLRFALTGVIVPVLQYILATTEQDNISCLSDSHLAHCHPELSPEDGDDEQSGQLVQSSSLSLTRVTSPSLLVTVSWVVFVWREMHRLSAAFVLCLCIRPICLVRCMYQMYSQYPFSRLTWKRGELMTFCRYIKELPASTSFSS